MATILSVTVPFFALVLLGYLSGLRGLVGTATVPGLNAYVLYLALPCLLYRFGASMPLRELLDPVLVAIYAGCALVMVGLGVALGRRRPALGMRDAAFGALVGAFPNSGFMGVPLLVALFGERASGPVLGTLLVDLFLTSTLCLALAHAQGGGGSPAGGDRMLAVAGRALRGALTNPQPWAIGLGALAAATALRLPAAVAQLVRMLADSATPVALFTIGVVLWRARAQAPARGGPARDALPLALLKLVAHPALVGMAGLAWRAAGGPVPSFGLTVLVLAAALPSASNASLLAERHGADNGRVARVILASTVLAFATFSLLAWRLSLHPL